MANITVLDAGMSRDGVADRAVPHAAVYVDNTRRLKVEWRVGVREYDPRVEATFPAVEKVSAGRLQVASALIIRRTANDGVRRGGHDTVVGYPPGVVPEATYSFA